MSITPGQTGRCPHCRLSVRFEPVRIKTGGSDYGPINPLLYISPSNHGLDVRSAACPACGRLILTAQTSIEPGQTPVVVEAQLWPDTGNRPVPAEVEREAPRLAADFREAVSVFPKSKKASAALARRCLQFILSTKGGARSKDLAKQIDEVLPSLPSGLADNVDAIRQVGNFAAHPIKSESSGEIADVEDGEAEWLLEVLEELFEYFFVAPARAAARRGALNEKLSALGKPPLKSSAKSE
jgi:hypothetical protein